MGSFKRNSFLVSLLESNHHWPILRKLRTFLKELLFHEVFLTVPFFMHPPLLRIPVALRDRQCTQPWCTPPCISLAKRGGGLTSLPSWMEATWQFCFSLQGLHQLPSNGSSCTAVSPQWYLFHKAVSMTFKCKADHRTTLLKTYNGFPSHLGKTQTLRLQPTVIPKPHLSDFHSLHSPITHPLSNAGCFCLRAFKLPIPSALFSFYLIFF